MSEWDPLLARLAEVPRENGTAALHRTARFLHETLESAGLEVEIVAFEAEPYALRLAGVLALVAVLAYARLMRAGRPLASAALAMAASAAILLQLEHVLPIFGWIGAQTQHHVVGVLPAAEPAQRLILMAHYDTKTDLLDHVERAPVDLLAAVVPPLLVLGALAAALAPRLPRHAARLRGCGRIATWAGLVYGVAAFLALAAGAFVPARSPGALDDGASCAILVRLAAALAADPALRRTELEVALVSAEEVGVQGSWVWARRRFAEPPDLPTAVVNLEGLGASTQLAVLGSERFTLRAFPPDPGIVAWLDRVYREHFDAPLERTRFGGGTDARSFLAHGIPAATLVGREPGQFFLRGLHSARDDRSRLDPAALDASLAYLLDAVRRFDRDGLPAP